MPQASWPLCCRRERPSASSEAASVVISWRRRPSIPHTADSSAYNRGKDGGNVLVRKFEEINVVNV